MDLLFPLRTPGLDLSSFDFRVYRDLTPIPLPASVMVTDVTGSGDYNAAGFPEGNPYLFTVTGAVADSTFAYSYGVKGSPPFVIIPIRAHLADPAAALTPILFKDGATAGGSLSFLEVGSPGDYAVSGWPLQATGAKWTLSWKYGGQVGSIDWTELPIGGATTINECAVAVAGVLRSGFSDLPFLEDANVETGEDPPAGGYVAIDGFEVLGEEQHSRGGPIATFVGTFWFAVQVFTPRNTGEGPAADYAERIAALYRGQQIGDLTIERVNTRARQAQKRDPYFQVDVVVIGEKVSSYQIA